MNNFTKFFFVVAMIMATHFCMANEFTTKSFHVKAVAIGKGQVYVHGYRAFGGSKEYGTLDKDGNYVPTEVLDWSGNIAEGQYREHQYVFSPYGAYAYIACKEHGEGIYPVQLYAVPEEGHKLLGVYGPNAEGTGPDYTKPYVSYRNEVNGEGVIWDDWEGRIDTDNPVAVTEAGILPESEENPNPAKHFNANWNVSSVGIVESTGTEDKTAVNARTDWSNLNTLFYVVFSDDTTGPSYTLTECRKFTNIPTKLDSRQSMLLDGKLYIKVKGTVEPQLMVYDATGILDTIIATPDANTTNICHDDAGNIIYRQSGAFPGVPGATEADVLTVITPDGERRTVTLPLAGAGLPATRLDFYSDVVGNILEGEAYFFYPESGTSNLYIITFNNGVVNPTKCGMVALDGAYSDTYAKVYPLGEGKFMYHYRGADPIIYTYAHNGSNWNVVKVGNIECPGRYNSVGLTTFKLDTVDYIAYPSGTGYFDGFSVAKLTTDGSEIEPVAVWEQTTTSQTTGFQTCWLHAEVVDDNTAVIYQYFPGGWVKAFRFTASLTTPDEYPAQVYMAGSYNSWNYASCTTLAQDNDLVGLYRTSAEIAFGENAAFAISEANGEEGAFNAAKWGVASDTTIVDQQPLSIVKGGENISIVSGNHTIIVDLLTHRVYGAGNLPYKKENKHHHMMTLVADTVMPTDELPGLLAYWQCTGTTENPGCMLYFADSLGTDTIGDDTALAAWLASEAILPVTYNKEDNYVSVSYSEEGETKVLNANTKYLERIKNVTEDEANSLLLIFREGTESVHAGDTIAIAEADLQSVEMKKGEELTPAIGRGTAKRTGNIDVNWIQLWENGPKFAEYNVGAANNKAEDYGGYYAWGGHQDKVDDHKSGTDPLSGNDDTATNLWGNNWRMPTKAELDDLLANCDVEWTVVNGVNGRKFTGKGDYASNSVFFPAAGRCNEGSVIGQDYYGFYWSSTPNGSLSAYNLLFSSGVQSVNNDGRSLGYSVRAVLVEE